MLVDHGRGRQAYVVKADSDAFGQSTAYPPAARRAADHRCCTPAEVSIDPDLTAAEAKAASGYACA